MKLPDHWFYAQPDEAGQYRLSESEARHAQRALRLHTGDTLQWTDGRGGRFTGSIEAIDRQGASLRVLAKAVEEVPPQLHLAVGTLHDAARMEWMVEKATELGATRITLLQTERCERPRYRLSRLEAKVIAALKQSGRAWMPVIEELSLKHVLQHDRAECRFVAYCSDEPARVPLYSTGLAPTTVILGPEGDLSAAEVAACIAAGFQGVSLGESRLRTETAALAALVILQQPSD